MNLTPHDPKWTPKCRKGDFRSDESALFFVLFFTLAVLAVRLVVWTFGGQIWVVLGSNSMNGGVKIVKS